MPESYVRGALTEATYLILLSLRKVRHGYEVMQHINRITNGRVNLGMGTLYGAINLLLEKGWIETTGGDDRRKMYQLTPDGRSTLENEMRRLSELLSLGKDDSSSSEGRGR